MSFPHDHSYEGKNIDIDNLFKEERWVQFLAERASEAVMNIQNNSNSDSSEMSTDISTQNGHLNGDSQEDAKWMETVLVLIVF